LFGRSGWTGLPHVLSAYCLCLDALCVPALVKTRPHFLPYGCALLCEDERAQRQDLLMGARTIYLQKI